MKALRKRPGEAAEEIQIDNTLEALQKEVGGYIESVTIATDLVILCDEEGRLKGKAHNCNLLGVDFVGSIIVAGVNGDEFSDVPKGILELLFRKEKAPTEAATSDVSAFTNNQVKSTSDFGNCQE
ncbi:DUF3846 domain-containing protein [Aminipila luticellarii]|uniref:DUF3846 domain-containing protein n=1 Tax=Aminipila luticellarii TaxID=2507160 RepID=A0A410PX07_9FIRM|nr:DUF3846 domain-containing protein [Aminipila luticellarii]QAT43469.1 DUF3846 domain-containing protein [Aminipila luticellarii]